MKNNRRKPKNEQKNLTTVKFRRGKTYRIEPTLETLMKVATYVKDMVNPGDDRDDVTNEFMYAVADVLFPDENYDGGTFYINGEEYDGTISLLYDLFDEDIINQAIDYVMNSINESRLGRRKSRRINEFKNSFKYINIRDEYVNTNILIEALNNFKKSGYNEVVLEYYDEGSQYWDNMTDDWYDDLRNQLEDGDIAFVENRTNIDDKSTFDLDGHDKIKDIYSIDEIIKKLKNVSEIMYDYDQDAFVYKRLNESKNLTQKLYTSINEFKRNLRK